MRENEALRKELKEKDQIISLLRSQISSAWHRLDFEYRSPVTASAYDHLSVRHRFAKAFLFRRMSIARSRSRICRRCPYWLWNNVSHSFNPLTSRLRNNVYLFFSPSFSMSRIYLFRAFFVYVSVCCVLIFIYDLYILIVVMLVKREVNSFLFHASSFPVACATSIIMMLNTNNYMRR